MSTPTMTNEQLLLRAYRDTWDEVDDFRTHEGHGPVVAWFKVLQGQQAGVYTSFASALSAQVGRTRISHSPSRSAAVSDVARAIFADRHPGPVPARLEEIMRRDTRPPATYPPQALLAAGGATPPPSPRAGSADGGLALPVAEPLHPGCLWLVVGAHEVSFLNDKELAQHAAYEMQLAGQFIGFFEATSFDDALVSLRRQAQLLKERSDARTTSGSTGGWGDQWGSGW
ncbi:hypothetical protein HMN09_00352500 [Mycena chlorophos]|uniref:Uncharacterized protein n=1 Tax=Mycena chlorophos TaxID=658473 RepID=A0A8H6TGT3_MYCCL|nr:hypothetical protein HMN09_00352500 [Mycena chlorophos]